MAINGLSALVDYVSLLVKKEDMMVLTLPLEEVVETLQVSVLAHDVLDLTGLSLETSGSNLSHPFMARLQRHQEKSRQPASQAASVLKRRVLSSLAFGYIIIGHEEFTAVLQMR